MLWQQLLLKGEEMISSLTNQKVKDWCKLHLKKYRDDSFLATGDVLLKAYQNGKLKTLIYTGNKTFEFEEAYEVSPEVMAKIAQREDIGAIGVASKIDEKEIDGNRIILLDRLQDPLNLGMILYAAHSFGFKTVVFSADCADIYHEKALEASHGAFYDCQDFRILIPSLKEKGYGVYATALRNDTIALSSLKEKEKMAFILGNEGSGVLEEWMEMTDDTVKIEMANIDSLNVAVAASIVMYQFSK